MNDSDFKYNPHDFSKPDYDDLSPNRTAQSNEEMLTVIKEMQDSGKRESVKTTIIMVISALALIISAIGCFR